MADDLQKNETESGGTHVRVFSTDWQQAIVGVTAMNHNQLLDIASQKQTIGDISCFRHRYK